LGAHDPRKIALSTTPQNWKSQLVKLQCPFILTNPLKMELGKLQCCMLTTYKLATRQPSTTLATTTPTPSPTRLAKLQPSHPHPRTHTRNGNWNGHECPHSHKIGRSTSQIKISTTLMQHHKIVTPLSYTLTIWNGLCPHGHTHKLTKLDSGSKFVRVLRIPILWCGRHLPKSRKTR
jgi:hypothetical protein